MITVVWDVTPCSLVGTKFREETTASIFRLCVISDELQ